MDSFLWWSGTIGWGIAGSVGLFLGADLVIDKIVDSWDEKRQFFAFVWDRLKAERDRNVGVG